MRVELLKKSVSIVGGEGAENLVDILFNKKNVNELSISTKLGFTINQTRNALYRLFDHGMVSFIRKKDKKNGGWYTYFWTLNDRRALEFLRDKLVEEIKELKEELKNRTEKRFYYSPEDEIEYTEEEALENGFISPETGEVLEVRDNSEIVNEMTKRLSEDESLVSSINEELEDIYKKTVASIARKERAEKAAKKKARAEKAAKKKTKKKAVKKTKKKTTKKTAKKKTKKKAVKKTKKKTTKKKTAKKKTKKKTSKKTKKKR